jgi:CheY-like chemotaxis protein
VKGYNRACFSRLKVAILLVVEDQPHDLRMADAAGRAAGFTTVQASTTIRAALDMLTKQSNGESSLPDAMLLDLDLGIESGYELLRFRCITPALAKVPVLVWTRLLQSNREICNLFKVNLFIEKADGPTALSEALLKLISLV